MDFSHMRPVYAVLAIATATLQGCGHGGGANAGGGPVLVPFQASGTTVVYAAPASGGPVSASAAFTAGTGLAAPGIQPGDTVGNTITLTTNAAGALTTIAINIASGGGGPTLSQNFAAVSQGNTTIPVTQLAAIMTAISTAPAATANAVYQGVAAGLSASAYGLWAQSIGAGSYNVGTYAFGVETPVMPTSGTANYKGATLGFGSNGTAPFVFTGLATMAVNFATNTVSSLQLSNLTTQDVNDTNPGPALANLTGTGLIVGNKYSFPIGGGALTGTTNGMFFGTSAAETAGTYAAANAAKTLTILGSYGLHQ
jgi:hypothetical protein